MRIDKIPEKVNLNFKNNEEQDISQPETREHVSSGPSSLYGRVGDNLTFHTQGAYKEGYLTLLWNWAWKDLVGSLGGLLRLFLPSRDK